MLNSLKNKVKRAAGAENTSHPKRGAFYPCCCQKEVMGGQSGLTSLLIKVKQDTKRIFIKSCDVKHHKNMGNFGENLTAAVHNKHKHAHDPFSVYSKVGVDDAIV